MQIHLQDAAVQAALIGGLFTLTAAIIAAAVAAVVGKRFDNQRRLKRHLRTAINDLAFALAVEDAHCEMHAKEHG